jgi:hypothetical protein
MAKRRALPGVLRHAADEDFRPQIPNLASKGVVFELKTGSKRAEIRRFL